MEAFSSLLVYVYSILLFTSFLICIKYFLVSKFIDTLEQSFYYI